MDGNRKPDKRSRHWPEAGESAMKVSGLFRAALVLAIGLLSSVPSHALNPEWEWKVTGFSPPVLQTKAAAVAYMHSLPNDSRYALLTVERRISSITDNAEQYTYEAPKLPAIEGAWCYLDATWGNPGGCRASESDWVSDRTGRVTSSPLCPAVTFTP
jgi:hypothetical protein